MRNGIGKPSNLQRTYELIPPHRRRAVLRKAFQRIDDIVGRKEATATEVLAALKALDMVLTLAAPNTPVDKLAEALLKPDEMPDEKFWPALEEMVEQRKRVVGYKN